MHHAQAPETAGVVIEGESRGRREEGGEGGVPPGLGEQEKELDQDSERR